MENEQQPSPEHLGKLQEYFDHPNFKPQQWEIIRSIIVDRRDNYVVMPSGYGKSLLYQYPSVFTDTDRMTIVISPLISLMQDQVSYLKSRSIPSCFLGSAQPDDLTPDIVAGMYRIVYLTPEYAMDPQGKLLLENVSDQLDLIAIDEAYCIIKWGSGFRSAFDKLGELRRNTILTEVPILAVTAVASPRARDDIMNALGLRNAQIWCTGIDRSNLEFQVILKGRQMWDDLEDLKGLLNQNKESSIIIYCRTRIQSHQMAELLNSNDIVCKAYHPDIDQDTRNEVRESFMENRVKIIVATEAFGMGINKQDVRLVIHYGAPADLETYYLEVGHAGRDGEQSNCIIFWNEGDFWMANQTQPNTMRQFLDTREDSRKTFILQYFQGINPV